MMRRYALSLLLLALPAVAPAQPSKPPPLSATAPKAAPVVIVSYPPAVVVRIDGKPVMTAVAGHPRVQRVANTRALILLGVKPESGPVADRRQDEGYYLRVGDAWMTATWLVGPWQPAALVPYQRRQLDAVAAELEKQGAVDPILLPARPPAGAVPQVFVTEVPATLVLFDGPPRYVPLAGTRLARATNADHEVLLDTAARKYFLRVDGEWLAASSLDGPWNAVAASALPAEVAGALPAARPGPSTSR